jgi:hypothetical protein
MGHGNPDFCYSLFTMCDHGVRMTYSSMRTLGIGRNTLVWLAVGLMGFSLAAFYVWGWWISCPALIGVLGALSVSSELLKTQLGECCESAFRAGQWARGLGFVIASGGCMAWGIASAVVALTSLEAPARTYAQVVESANVELSKIDHALERLPQLTPSMPTTRMKEMGRQIDAQREALEARRMRIQVAVLGGLPKGGALIAAPWWAKVLISALIEVIVFLVPWIIRTPSSIPGTRQVIERPPEVSPEKVVALFRQLPAELKSRTSGAILAEVRKAKGGYAKAPRRA